MASFPYCGTNRNLYLCPSQQRFGTVYWSVMLSKWFNPPAIVQGNPSYGYNEFGTGALPVLGLNNNGVLGLGAIYPSTTATPAPVRESDVVSPANLMAVGDFDPLDWIIYTGPPTGSSGGFTVTNSNAFPGGISPGFPLGDVTGPVDGRHNGGANIVFCDAHVEYGKYLQWTNTLSPRWNRDHQSHPDGVF